MLNAYSSRLTGFGSTMGGCLTKLYGQLNQVDERLTHHVNSIHQSEQSIKHQLMEAKHKLQMLEERLASRRRLTEHSAATYKQKLRMLDSEEGLRVEIERTTLKVQKLNKLSRKAEQMMEQAKKYKSNGQDVIQRFHTIARDFRNDINDRISYGNRYLKESADILMAYKGT